MKVSGCLPHRSGRPRAVGPLHVFLQAWGRLEGNLITTSRSKTGRGWIRRAGGEGGPKTGTTSAMGAAASWLLALTLTPRVPQPRGDSRSKLSRRTSARQQFRARQRRRPSPAKIGKKSKDARNRCATQQFEKNDASSPLIRLKGTTYSTGRLAPSCCALQSAPINQLLSGAPFRTLRLCCSRRGGNWSWGSVVSHSLKSACGSSALSSFSRAGNQATTRCRFLRHSQSPA